MASQLTAVAAGLEALRVQGAEQTAATAETAEKMTEMQQRLAQHDALLTGDGPSVLSTAAPVARLQDWEIRVPQGAAGGKNPLQPQDLQSHRNDGNRGRLEVRGSVAGGAQRPHPGVLARRLVRPAEAAALTDGSREGGLFVRLTEDQPGLGGRRPPEPLPHKGGSHLQRGRGARHRELGGTL